MKERIAESRISQDFRKNVQNVDQKYDQLLNLALWFNKENTKRIHTRTSVFLFPFKKIISNFYIPPMRFPDMNSYVDKSPDRERGNCLETENAVSTASMNAKTFAEYSIVETLHFPLILAISSAVPSE